MTVEGKIFCVELKHANARWSNTTYINIHKETDEIHKTQGDLKC